MAFRHRFPFPFPIRSAARAVVLPAVLLVTSLVVASAPTGSSAVAPGAGAAVLAADGATARRADALAPCRMKPKMTNTGARGDLSASGRTTLGDGATLKNARVSDLTISGNGVKVRNVRVDGTVLITGENVRIKRVTAEHIGISSAVNVLVAKSNIGYSPDDGIHVTSDGDRLVRNVELRYNLVHHPEAPPESHYDGTQVRGVDGMVIRCSVYRAGPFQETMNANIFLENANGGVSDVTIARNWLYGSAWSVMVSADSARLIGNRVGGDPHWGYCYLSSGKDSIEASGNKALDGSRVRLCGEG